MPDGHEYDHLYEATEEILYRRGRHVTPLTQTRIRLLLSLLQPGRMFLDLGCGPAELIRDACEQNLFDRYVGVDASARGIAIGLKYIHNPRIELHVADITTFLAQWNEMADCVVCSDILEHLPEAQIMDVLRLVRERMMPGASLIITVPNAYGDRFNRIAHHRLISREKALDMDIFRAFPDLHISLFSKQKWWRLLQSHGFELGLFRSVDFPIIHSEWLCRQFPQAGLGWLFKARRV